MGQWGVAGLFGPAGDCTSAIEALNAPEAQWNGRVRRHGPVQPPCYTHRRPIDGAPIACSSWPPGIDAGCLVSAAILGGACFVVLYEISPCWVPEEMDCGRFPGRCARTQCSNRRVRALSGLRFHTCPQLIRFAVKSTESYLWLPCGRIEAHQSTALTAWGCWVLRWVPGRPEWPPGAYLRGGTPASEISNPRNSCSPEPSSASRPPARLRRR